MITDSRKDALFICTSILNKFKATRKTNQKEKTLQVHDYYSRFFFHFSYVLKCIKRVSLRLSVKVTASVSIEASIAIPIFLFSFLEILSVLNYLSVYSGVLYALKSAVEPVAVYGYAYEELVSSEREISLGEDVITSLIFSEAYLDTQIRNVCDSKLYENTIKGGIKGINLLGSHVNHEKSCVDVLAYYTVRPLISFAGTQQFMINRYYTRLWTGYSLEETTVSEEYVYVTENRSVYHLSEDCTHLRLSISRVRAEELYDLRNASGEKYLECSKCCDEERIREAYYITEQGDRYHTEIMCSGLKRTIYCVEKDEVKALPVCSRCNQVKGE